MWSMGVIMGGVFINCICEGHVGSLANLARVKTCQCHAAAIWRKYKMLRFPDIGQNFMTSVASAVPPPLVQASEMLLYTSQTTMHHGHSTCNAQLSGLSLH